MHAKNSLLNILCYELPGFLTQPIYREFDSRKSHILNIWERGYESYKGLQDYENIIDSLLAISIYYRYIIGCMNGASDFFSYLNKQEGRKKDCNIRCGEFRLNREQYNKMLSVCISFNKIKEKYQLSDAFFTYSETIDFLKNCKDLLIKPENTSEETTRNE